MCPAEVHIPIQRERGEGTKGVRRGVRGLEGELKSTLRSVQPRPIHLYIGRGGRGVFGSGNVKRVLVIKESSQR